MSVIKSERTLKDPRRLREIREEARMYGESFAKMRAHVLERAVPSYILSLSGFDLNMEAVYSPDVQQGLDLIKKMEDYEMSRFQKQVLDAGYDIEE